MSATVLYTCDSCPTRWEEGSGGGARVRFVAGEDVRADRGGHKTEYTREVQYMEIDLCSACLGRELVARIEAMPEEARRGLVRDVKARKAGRTEGRP